MLTFYMPNIVHLMYSWVIKTFIINGSFVCWRMLDTHSYSEQRALSVGQRKIVSSTLIEIVKCRMLFEFFVWLQPWLFPCFLDQIISVFTNDSMTENDIWQREIILVLIQTQSFLETELFKRPVNESDKYGIGIA